MGHSPEKRAGLEVGGGAGGRREDQGYVSGQMCTTLHVRHTLTCTANERVFPTEQEAQHQCHAGKGRYHDNHQEESLPSALQIHDVHI